MKTKLFFSICLMLLAASITAQASIPQGIWTVTQITIEKNIDGIIQTSVYNTPVEGHRFIPFLKGLEVNVEDMVLHYDGWEEISPSYTVSGNYLTLMSEMFQHPIPYSLSGGVLTLLTTHNYIYNTAAGQVKQITENRTINLKQQN